VTDDYGDDAYYTAEVKHSVVRTAVLTRFSKGRNEDIIVHLQVELLLFFFGVKKMIRMTRCVTEFLGSFSVLARILRLFV
jgi:hypothetical protein